jgi:ParB-like chromosome segregation protein Spo0J
MQSHVIEHPLTDIKENYASLRIANPKAESMLEKSLEKYGQVSPVVCQRTEKALELIDGFKRYRALQRLKRDTIQVTLLETTVRVCKAGIIQLNRTSRSISDLEEALVIQSLHREEMMPQIEIALLLGRDKSWVSRRLSLIERVADEVRSHIEIGLIPVSIGRELARLPRGNQSVVLDFVEKQHLGKREVEKLVRLLLAKPLRDWSRVLNKEWRSLSSEKEETCFTHQLAALDELQKAIVVKLSCATVEPLPLSLLAATLESNRKLDATLSHLLSHRNGENAR